MPDDFVLNVRQISQYAAQPAVGANAAVLVQLNGMGGPYGSVAASTLVSTALAGGGDMSVAGTLWVDAVSTPSLQATAASIDSLNVNGVVAQSIDAASLSISGQPIAMLSDVQKLAARPFVSSVSGRSGAVMLSVDDVMGAAPAHSPFFGGTPRANTPWGHAADGELVTAEWVRKFFLNGNAVASFNGRRGAVHLRLTDLLQVGGAPILNPEFVGKPMAPTPPGYDSSDRLATTRFVQWAIVEGGWPGPPGPVGPKGPPGTGFNLRGTVPDASFLPPAGNEVSDMFIAEDTDVGYVWTGTAWQPIGMITPSARVYVSDTTPLTASNGDLWWNSSSGELFVYYDGPGGGTWVQANTGIEGAQGPQGDPGAPGPNVSIGTSPPVGPTQGLLWFNPSTGNTMIWNGSWVPVSEPVPPSATVSVGPAPPVGAVEGDLWFDTNTTGELMVYLQGFWVAAAAGIEGPQGPTGPPGIPGVQGIQGVMGPPGTGIQFLGDVADHPSLPAGAANGDAYITADTGDLWVSDGAGGWMGPYTFGGGIPEAPTPGIYGRENGGWVQLLDDGVF